MVVLGIDPGSHVTGYAVLNVQGRNFKVCASGAMRLSNEGDLSARLGLLLGQLSDILDRHHPEVVAVEDVFAAVNARSALALGQARGVVLAAVGRAGIPVCAYAPALVKRAIAGHGRADKSQIQQMVQALLALSNRPSPDEADAIAIAMCHALQLRNPMASVPR